MIIAYGEDIVLQNGDALQSEITMTAPRVTFTPKNDTEYTLAMVSILLFIFRCTCSYLFFSPVD